MDNAIASELLRNACRNKNNSIKNSFETAIPLSQIFAAYSTKMQGI
jgi:hypothetical protein